MHKRTQRTTPASAPTASATFDPAAIRGAIGQFCLRLIARDFQREGPQQLARLREKRPSEYFKLVLALMPKEYRFKEVELPQIPDAELSAMLDALREVIAEKEKEQGRSPSNPPP